MADLSQGASSISFDARGLDSLKNTAAKKPEKALKDAAVQFEALFLNQLMKAMRESLPKDGMMHSAATDSYTSMLDQQLAQSMAKQGTGLARMIERQLARQMAKPEGTPAGQGVQVPVKIVPQGAAGVSDVRAVATPFAVPRATAKTESQLAGQRDFLNSVIENAKSAASSSGVSAVFIAAQAALESGWGKREIRSADGTPAHNLFGIKAGRGWNGATADVTTTEYVNGVAVKSVEKFRAYASYAEGLRDYVSMLTQNSRYRDVVAQGQDAQGFAQGLQRAGYATDPAYASKLSQVIQQAVRITGLA